MSVRIISSWASGGSITPYQEGWTVEQWIDAAELDFKAALSADPPDTAYPITTTWKSAGQPIVVSTPHNPGESIPDWEARHWAKVRAEMAVHTPDTN